MRSIDRHAPGAIGLPVYSDNPSEIEQLASPKPETGTPITKHAMQKGPIRSSRAGLPMR